MSNYTALIIIAVAGWLLTTYFGFFRFKQYVWSRHKVSYDLFTRQNQRRQSLGNRLRRLAAVAKEGKGIRLKRELAAAAYLEQLRESQLLAARGIVGPAQVKHWITAIVNQLRLMDTSTLELLRETDRSLVNEFIPLDTFLHAVLNESLDMKELYRAFTADHLHHP